MMDDSVRIKKYKKIFSVLFLTAAFLMIFLPGILTNRERNAESYIDNRLLREMPDYRNGKRLEAADSAGGWRGLAGVVLDGTFESDLGKVLEDRVGFRNAAIQSYQNICAAVFDELIHPQYIYGKDKWIFTDWDLGNYMHMPSDTTYVSLVGTYVGRMKAISEMEGAQFYFALAPDKESIYPEYYSSAYRVNTAQPNRSDLICESLENNDVNVIDLRIPLREAAAEGIMVCNQKYDAGHWNYTGAFYANRAIVKRLQEVWPSMPLPEASEYDITVKTEPFLPQSRFRIDDPTPVYTLKNDPTIGNPAGFWDDVRLVDPNEFHQYIINPEGEGLPKVLVFGDSFFGSYNEFEFLDTRCSEVMLLHNNNISLFAYYVRLFCPDIVIVEGAERTFSTASAAFSPYAVAAGLEENP